MSGAGWDLHWDPADLVLSTCVGWFWSCPKVRVLYLCNKSGLWILSSRMAWSLPDHVARFPHFMELARAYFV
jgi:hypothetical protein